MFIGGAADPSIDLTRALYDQLEAYLPNLRKKVLLPGVGHSAPEEDVQTVNNLLLDFLAAI
jgi:pimeloyl-ACP methyl ester carboxylesterase